MQEIGADKNPSFEQQKQLTDFMNWFQKNYPAFYEQYAGELEWTADGVSKVRISQAAQLDEEERGWLKSVLELYEYQCKEKG